MGTYLNPGNRGFARIRQSKYVDKTGLIGRINETIGTMQSLTCVSRPRRFGKSYAAQMLCAYYDRSCDSHMLFQDLCISKHPTYNQHRNQYDVIYLDMTSVIGEAGLTDLIAYLKRNIRLELQDAYPEVRQEEGLVPTLINTVTCTGRQIVMIIDEWDAPIREAKDQVPIQREYLEFLRLLFKNSGATARIFAAVYMTGILPIKKDGTQSAVSDFQEYSILYPDGLAEYIGFTEEEVKTLCREYDMDLAQCKAWYDGYWFEETGAMYNPFSVMSAMRNRKYRSYWQKTSAAESLMTYIDMNYQGLQEDILRLISGEHIEINPNSFENDFVSFRGKNDVLTLLVHLGYLAYVEEERAVRIPNEEIRNEFENVLENTKSPKLLQLIRTSQDLLRSTLAGDEQAVADAIEAVRDSAYAPAYYNDEQALRYVIKFAYIVCVDQYARVEELPSGRGVADVVYLPKQHSHLPAMVIELKWDKTASAAVQQIREHKYPAVLRDFTRQIVLVGINYDPKTKKHSCRIEWVEEAAV